MASSSLKCPMASCLRGQRRALLLYWSMPRISSRSVMSSFASRRTGVIELKWFEHSCSLVLCQWLQAIHSCRPMQTSCSWPTLSIVEVLTARTPPTMRRSRRGRRADGQDSDWVVHCKQPPHQAYVTSTNLAALMTKLDGH